MAEYHHGPEVVEHFEGGRTVRDIKAAVTYLIGTAPVHLVHEAPARANYIDKDIIVRRKEDAIAAFGEFDAAAGYSIPSALHAAFNKDRGTGIGTWIVRNVFDPDVHKDGANAPDPTEVGATDIIGELATGDIPKGLEACYYTYQKFGYFPRRIIAPGFGTLLGVRQKMLTVANKVHAHAVVDLPPGLTKQQIVETRGVAQPYQLGDDRMVYCAPHVWALDAITGEQSLQPYSQHFAGVWNEVVQREEGDDDGGVAASPSNRKMPDVSGLEIPLQFYPGDHSSDTNFLNEAGIVTANMGQFGSGIVTWGAHASSQASIADSQLTRWLHVRAMYDALHEAILFYLMPWIDRRGTVANVDMIEDQIQRYIERKERDGWLYGGRFRFNRAKNTPEEIVNEGRFWYRLDAAPIAVMHRITVESYIDLAFVKTALGLSETTA